MKKELSKSKQLELRYGGKWKYDGLATWECDDNKRYVSRTSACLCDDYCSHPPRYILYNEHKYIEDVYWFIKGIL